jgi:hypothetical protein
MSLNYNPLFTNENPHLTLSNDADPDFHLYGHLNFSCDYLNEEQLNKLVQNELHFSPFEYT